MNLRVCTLALTLACTACGDDSDANPSGTSSGTGTTPTDGTGGGTTSGDPDTGETSQPDSSGGDSSTGTSDGSGSSSSGGGSSSTGEPVDCDLLAPIMDPPDPQPPVGACGYALPMPNKDCGPQPLPGTMVCAATLEAFDPAGPDDPDPTDWRCANASGGGYCIELQAGLYTFCATPITSLDDYESECVPCLLELPEDGPIELSYEMGPVWDAPECADLG